MIVSLILWVECSIPVRGQTGPCNFLTGTITTIEIHRIIELEVQFYDRIEMTSLSQRTAPGGQSRRVPL